MQKKKAFTLVEIIAVLTVLGIVAAITIPIALRNNTERANKTRIRKAMAAYESVVEKIIVENGVRSNDAIKQFLSENNCANAREYFKIVLTETPQNNCRFRAADGLWWDVTDITNTLVAFKDEDLAWVTAGGSEFKAFKFVTRFDPNGSPRINDFGFTTYSYKNDGDKKTYDIPYTEAIKKVHAYLDNEEYIENVIAKYSKPCFDNILKNRCYGGGDCTGCTTIWNRGEGINDYWGQWIIHVYDDKGREIAYQWKCNPETTFCTQNATIDRVFIPFEKNLELAGYECDNSFHTCTIRWLRKTNPDGSQCTCNGCDGVTAAGAQSPPYYQNGKYKDENGVEQIVKADSCKAKNSCSQCDGNCPERDSQDHCYHL